MSQAQIANLQVALSANTAQFSAGLAEAKSKLQSFGSSLKSFATGAAAVAVFSQAVEALHQVADIGDVAESIGITAEQLQVFNRLALASNTSTDVMTRGLQSIAEQSVDANSALSKLFTANNLTTAGKDMNQIILDFMTLLQNAKNPAEQLAIATDVLGTKVGRNLVEAMRVGREGWVTEQENMKQSGNYLADQSVADAQRIETAYNQMIANIGTAWQSMVVTILSDTQKLFTTTVQNPEFLPGGGRGGPIKNPNYKPPGRTSGMGAAGGPNEFAYPPVKVNVTVLPPSKEQTDTVKKVIAEKITPDPISPDIDTSQWDQAQQIIEDTMSPLEQYKASIKNLNDVYNSGALTSDQYHLAVKKLQDDFTEAAPAADEFSNSLADIGSTISDSLGYAIEGLISGTMSLKDAFRSMAASVSQQLAQMAAQLARSALVKVLGMFLGGSGFSFGGMSFGGFYANGGQLGSGKWGIAGEAGPEIVHGPANITPMGKGAAPQMNVTVINNTSSQVRTKQATDGSLKVFIEEAMADLVVRGGNKVDAALARGYGLKRAGR